MKKSIAKILVIFFLSLAVFPAISHAACNNDGTCNYKAGEDIFNCKADCLKIGNATKSVVVAIHDVTDWILGFATALCVIMIIIGGIYYVSSAGDQEQATTGKKILKYSLMGLVVVGISYALIVVVNDVLT